MRTALHLKLLSSLIGLFTLLSPLSAAATAISLAATDDALVNSTKPDKLYGLTAYLSVYYDGSVYNRSYLKFDLSALPDNALITSAQLSLYAMTSNNYALPTVAVQHVSDDGWDEATLNWVNRPGYGARLASSQPVIGAWQDFDLLANGAWNFADDLADDAVSLMLMEGEALSSTVKQVWYSPGEQQTYYVYQPPRLELEWRVVPSPSTLSLVALTLFVLGLTRRLSTPAAA